MFSIFIHFFTLRKSDGQLIYWLTSLFPECFFARRKSDGQSTDWRTSLFPECKVTVFPKKRLYVNVSS